MQVKAFVGGLFETRHDLASFKTQLRDFLIQSKEFSAQVSLQDCAYIWGWKITDLTVLFIIYVQDNKDLYADEAAAQRELERQRMLSIPGLIAPVEIQDEMGDT